MPVFVLGNKPIVAEFTAFVKYNTKIVVKIVLINSIKSVQILHAFDCLKIDGSVLFSQLRAEVEGTCSVATDGLDLNRITEFSFAESILGC